MDKIIIASGPVIVEGGKVLLDKHGQDDFWKFCGGRVDNLSASLADHARRKVKEEMGVDIEIIDPKPFLLYVSKEPGEGPIDVLLVHFLAKRIGEVVPGADIREWQWFDIEHLPDDLAPNILPTLKHFGFFR